MGLAVVAQVVVVGTDLTAGPTVGLSTGLSRHLSAGPPNPSADLASGEVVLLLLLLLQVLLGHALLAPSSLSYLRVSSKEALLLGI